MEQSLKDQAGVIDEQVRGAIQEGPVTRQYLADPKNIVSSLNRLRSTEITSYLQYKQHSYMAVSLLSPGLKTEFESHAQQELTHADRLAGRIQQLGGVPIFDPEEIGRTAKRAHVNVSQGATIEQMVREDLEVEIAQGVKVKLLRGSVSDVRSKAEPVNDNKAA